MPATKRPATESGHEVGPRASKSRRTLAQGSVSAREPGEAQGRRVTWQSLPAEIQGQIVGRLAPGSFELYDVPEEPLLGGLQHAPDWEEHKVRRKALGSLCMASKTLQCIALPLLYQNVVLLNLASLSKFYRTLVRFPERGRLVKQLTYSLDRRVIVAEVPIRFRTTDVDFLAPRFKFQGVWETPYDGPLDHIRSKVLESFKSRSGRPNLFRHDITCALIFPIMALAPNLSNLNVAGFSSRMSRRFDGHALDRDILLAFLLGTESDESLGRLRQVLGSWFPQDIFGLKQEKFGTAPVFPPPSLKLINVLMHPADSPTNMVANRVRLFAPWACRQLRSITERIEPGLQIPRNQEGDLRPSLVLQNMRDCEISQFLSIRDFIVKIDRLKEDLFPKERDYGSSDDQASSITRYRNLDFALEMTEALPHNVIIGSQDISLDLYSLYKIERSRSSIGTQVTRLTIHDAYSGPYRFSFVWTLNRSLQTMMEQNFIQQHFPGLKVLDMDIRPKKDVRWTVLQDFDPGQFESVERLSITTEILWGPVRSVMDMLVVRGDEMSERMVPRFVQGVDGNPVLDEAGSPIPLPDVWARQNKAINRIPRNCTSICIRDWFAEYEPIITPKAPLELLGVNNMAQRSREGRAEMRRELKAAVHNNTFLNNPVVVSLLRSCSNFNQAVAHVYSHHPDETRYSYPSIRGDACWDPEPLCVAEKVDDFVDRFIPALCSGLMAMCALRRSGAPPAITRLRPQLKKISFIYTLHSNLPDREDDWHASYADLKWRMWYHSGLENCDSGYGLLKKHIKEGSGIDFEVWEGVEGVVPKEPLWPDKRKARASGMTVPSGEYDGRSMERPAKRHKAGRTTDGAIVGLSGEPGVSGSSGTLTPAEVENMALRMANLGFAQE